MKTDAKWLRAAEMWWMTGNVWEDGGFSRKAEDIQMWMSLLTWAGWPE